MQMVDLGDKFLNNIKKFYDDFGSPDTTDVHVWMDLVDKAKQVMHENNDRYLYRLSKCQIWDLLALFRVMRSDGYYYHNMFGEYENNKFKYYSSWKQFLQKVTGKLFTFWTKVRKHVDYVYKHIIS